MKPDDPRHPWSRLTAAARTVRDERDLAAPYGFATRVTALARDGETRLLPLFERFALRAVGVAGLLAVLSVVMNYPALAGAAGVERRDEPVMLPTDDTVVMFDLME
ncbi:MAG: hypothetical protein WD941_04090 [Opitutus sp.]